MNMQATKEDADAAYSAYRRFLVEGTELVRRNPALKNSFEREKASIETMLKGTGAAMQRADWEIRDDDREDDGLGFLPLLIGAGATLVSGAALKSIASRALGWLGAASAATVGSAIGGATGAAIGAKVATPTETSPTSPSTSTNVATIVRWLVIGGGVFLAYKIWKAAK